MAITGGTPILLPEMGPLPGKGVVERIRSIGVDIEAWVEVPRPARATPEQAALLGIGVGDLVQSLERTPRGAKHADPLPTCCPTPQPRSISGHVSYATSHGGHGQAVFSTVPWPSK
jgi:hypothetical protein